MEAEREQVGETEGTNRVDAKVEEEKKLSPEQDALVEELAEYIKKQGSFIAVTGSDFGSNPVSYMALYELYK